MPDDQNFGIDPAAAYRYREGPRLFGLQKSQLNDAIKAGLIPAPFPVVEGGNAKIWIGIQIIEHRRQRMAVARDRQQNAA
jgi:hypothetical protein